jgi:23S rRNA pseudouridine1911/1915/1917 synthase
MLELAYPDEDLYLIHRLDRETSGVLLMARGSEADRAFKMLFEGLPPRTGAAPEPHAPRRRLVDKTYLAICRGSPDDGLIDSPLEPDTDNPLRVKMRIAPPGSGLESRTVVETVARCAGYSLVRCSLLTGRQHQIRVHLSSRGCPVVGDKLYGPDDRLLARAADGELTAEDLQTLELPRHALHATRYRLQHPLTGRPLDLAAPLAPDLEEFWASVSGSAPPVG